MDNQHRKIQGHRELTQDEIDLMNEIKSEGVRLGDLIATLKQMPDIDQRWVALGTTDLMALTRAVAQPTSF